MTHNHIISNIIGMFHVKLPSSLEHTVYFSRFPQYGASYNWWRKNDGDRFIMYFMALFQTHASLTLSSWQFLHGNTQFFHSAMIPETDGFLLSAFSPVLIVYKSVCYWVLWILQKKRQLCVTWSIFQDWKCSLKWISLFFIYSDSDF